jgi:non-ribosomal peptide synthetase component F
VLGPALQADEALSELTYGELEASANRLARQLREGAGVRPGAVVAILLERCSALYVAMLAVLKAGAAYVSIDPDYPDDRALYMLQVSQPALLVTIIRACWHLTKWPSPCA